MKKSGIYSVMFFCTVLILLGSLANTFKNPEYIRGLIRQNLNGYQFPEKFDAPIIPNIPEPPSFQFPGVKPSFRNDRYFNRFTDIPSFDTLNKDLQINFPERRISNFPRYLPFFKYPSIPTAFDSNAILDLKDIKRAPDGNGNNEEYPDYGAVGAQLQRKLPPVYENGANSPVANKPEPRIISNQVGSMGKFENDPSHLSFLFTIWGQFIDHDLDLTTEQEGNSAESLKIQVPKCDQFFDKQCTGNEFIPFKRSKFISNNPRQFANEITSFIDGGQIYGTGAQSLRDNLDGLMTTSPGNLLPKDNNGFFEAGDIRANENSILSSIHTLFVREHNRVCKKLNKKHPGLSDEDAYHISKNYVIGLLQKITYDDYLPNLLGPHLYKTYIGKYKGYNPKINPTIFTEFAAAAYRFGHSLLASQIPQVNYQNQVIKTFKIDELFFEPKLITEYSVDYFLNGALRTPAKRKTAQIVDAVRNFLVPDPDRKEIDLDLFSLNVMRGRDHGLADYNSYRTAYGLEEIASFEEMTSNETAHRLGKVYESVSDLDIWVGVIAEDSVMGGVLGPVGARLVGENFRNVRNGDRFWYENVFPKEIVHEIKRTTLADVIRRNTKLVSISQDVFTNYW